MESSGSILFGLWGRAGLKALPAAGRPGATFKSKARPRAGPGYGGRDATRSPIARDNACFASGKCTTGIPKRGIRTLCCRSSFSRVIRGKEAAACIFALGAALKAGARQRQASASFNNVRTQRVILSNEPGRSSRTLREFSYSSIVRAVCERRVFGLDPRANPPA